MGKKLIESEAFSNRLRDSRRVAPLEAGWDDFFDAPGIKIGAREQTVVQAGEAIGVLHGFPPTPVR